MKILFYTSYPTQESGYSRIGNIITNYLSEKNNEVHYYGINNNLNTFIERYIDKNIILIDGEEEENKLETKELYCINSLCNYIEIIAPDILFLYNEITVISQVLKIFNEKNMNINFKIFTYLDLIFPYEKINLITEVDNYSNIIFVYSEYWKENLIKMGIKEEKIEILQPGFDDKSFFEIDKIDAKKYFKFKEDDFIILNSCKNNCIKGIDKTIDAFVKFIKLKNKNNIKLFLYMNLMNIKNQGYNIEDYFRISCLKYDANYIDLINNNVFVKENNLYSDQKLNFLYNACDIGINTSIGEGFGICNLEHAGLGKPQIVSNIGGLKDIFKKENSIPIVPVSEIYVSSNIYFPGGYAKICSTDDFVSAIDKYYENADIILEHGTKCKKMILEKFNWKKILEKLNNIINDEFYLNKKL